MKIGEGPSACFKSDGANCLASLSIAPTAIHLLTRLSDAEKLSKPNRKTAEPPCSTVSADTYPTSQSAFQQAVPLWRSLPLNLKGRACVGPFFRLHTSICYWSGYYAETLDKGPCIAGPID